MQTNPTNINGTLEPELNRAIPFGSFDKLEQFAKDLGFSDLQQIGSEVFASGAVLGIFAKQVGNNYYLTTAVSKSILELIKPGNPKETGSNTNPNTSPALTRLLSGENLSPVDLAKLDNYIRILRGCGNIALRMAEVCRAREQTAETRTFDQATFHCNN